MTLRAIALAAALLAASASIAAADCPDAPGYCNAVVGPGCTTIDVTWPFEAGATSYDVYRSLNTAPPSWSLLTNTTGFSHFDGTAVPGQAYIYRVQSRTTPGPAPFGCPGGLGGTSAPSSPKSIPTPPAPMSPAFIQPICTANYLTWTSLGTSCKVFRGTSGTFAGATELATLAPTTPPSWSYTDSTSASGVTYDYWIVQYNDCKSGPPSGPVFYTNTLTTPPSAPAVSIQSWSECGEIALTWSEVPTAYDYAVLITDSAGNFVNMVETPATHYSMGTSSTETFTFRVRARNSCGYGAFSAPLSGVAPQPGGGAIFPPVSCGQIVNAGTPGSIASVFPGTPTAMVWLKDGVPVVASGRITGVNSATLSFAPFHPGDVGVYRLNATGPCGPVTTGDILLAVRPGCPADFDSSGITSIDDLFLYINAYFSACP